MYHEPQCKKREMRLANKRNGRDHSTKEIKTDLRVVSSSLDGGEVNFIIRLIMYCLLPNSALQ